MDIDLSKLSESEYDSIFQVLQRDQKLRKFEERRIHQLRTEIQRLRKRGVLRPGLDSTRACSRCLAELGRIINRGALCPACKKRVCKSCRQYRDDGKQWLCVVCEKQRELKAISGEWMQGLSCNSSRRKGTRSSAPGDILWKTLQSRFRKSVAFSDKHVTNETEEQATTSTAPFTSVSSVPKKPPRTFDYKTNAFAPDKNSSTRNSSELGAIPKGEVPVAKCTDESRHFVYPPPTDMDRTVLKKVSRRRKSSSSSSVEEDHGGGQEDVPIRSNVPRTSPLSGKRGPQSSVIPVRGDTPPSPRESRLSADGSPIKHRSQSTSSEDQTVPVPTPRKRLSPLRKQQAVVEPLETSSVDAVDPVVPKQDSKFTLLGSTHDSGVTDLSCPVSPRTFSSDHSRQSSDLAGESSIDQGLPSPSASSLSESEIEKTTGVIFKKVNLKKKRSSEEVTEKYPNALKSTPSQLDCLISRTNPNRHSKLTLNIKPVVCNSGVELVNLQRDITPHTNTRGLLNCSLDELTTLLSNSNNNARSMQISDNQFRFIQSSTFPGNTSGNFQSSSFSEGCMLVRVPTSVFDTFESNSQTFNWPSMRVIADNQTKPFLTSVEVGSPSVSPLPSNFRSQLTVHSDGADQGLTTEEQRTIRRDSVSSTPTASPPLQRVKQFDRSSRRLRLRMQSRQSPECDNNRSSHAKFPAIPTFCCEEPATLFRARSASLPTRQGINNWSGSWSPCSMEGQMWRLEEDMALAAALLESQSEPDLDVDKIMPEGDDYKLVFISSSCSSQSSDLDSVAGSSDDEVGCGRIMRVRSHMEISNGAVYIEDSDWEFFSDSDYAKRISSAQSAADSSSSEIFFLDDLEPAGERSSPTRILEEISCEDENFQNRSKREGFSDPSFIENRNLGKVSPDPPGIEIDPGCSFLEESRATKSQTLAESEVSITSDFKVTVKVAEIPRDNSVKEFETPLNSAVGFLEPSRRENITQQYGCSTGAKSALFETSVISEQHLPNVTFSTSPCEWTNSHNAYENHSEKDKKLDRVARVKRSLTSQSEEKVYNRNSSAGKSQDSWLFPLPSPELSRDQPACLISLRVQPNLQNIGLTNQIEVIRKFALSDNYCTKENEKWSTSKDDSQIKYENVLYLQPRESVTDEVQGISLLSIHEKTISNESTLMERLASAREQISLHSVLACDDNKNMPETDYNVQLIQHDNASEITGSQMCSEKVSICQDSFTSEPILLSFEIDLHGKNKNRKEVNSNVAVNFNKQDVHNQQVNDITGEGIQKQILPLSATSELSEQLSYKNSHSHDTVNLINTEQVVNLCHKEPVSIDGMNQYWTENIRLPPSEKHSCEFCYNLLLPKQSGSTVDKQVCDDVLYCYYNIPNEKKSVHQLDYMSFYPKISNKENTQKQKFDEHVFFPQINAIIPCNTESQSNVCHESFEDVMNDSEFNSPNKVRLENHQIIENTLQNKELFQENGFGLQQMGQQSNKLSPQKSDTFREVYNNQVISTSLTEKCVSSKPEVDTKLYQKKTAHDKCTNCQQAYDNVLFFQGHVTRDSIREHQVGNVAFSDKGEANVGPQFENIVLHSKYNKCEDLCVSESENNDNLEKKEIKDSHSCEECLIEVNTQSKDKGMVVFRESAVSESTNKFMLTEDSHRGGEEKQWIHLFQSGADEDHLSKSHDFASQDNSNKNKWKLEALPEPNNNDKLLPRLNTEFNHSLVLDLMFGNKTSLLLTMDDAGITSLFSGSVSNKEIPITVDSGELDKLPEPTDTNDSKKAWKLSEWKCIKENLSLTVLKGTELIPPLPVSGIYESSLISVNINCPENILMLPDSENVNKTSELPNLEDTEKTPVALPGSELVMEIAAYSNSEDANNMFPLPESGNVTKQPVIHDLENAKEIQIMTDSKDTEEVLTLPDTRETLTLHETKGTTEESILPNLEGIKSTTVDVSEGAKEVTSIHGSENLKVRTLPDTEEIKEATIIVHSNDNEKLLILTDKEGTKVPVLLGTEDTKEATTVNDPDANEKTQTFLNQKFTKDIKLLNSEDSQGSISKDEPDNIDKSLILPDQKVIKEATAINDSDNADKSRILHDQEIAEEVPASPDQEVTKEATAIDDPDNTDKSLTLCDQEVTKEVPTSPDQEVTEEATAVHDPNNAKKSLILCDQKVTKQAPTSPDQEVTKKATAIDDPDNANKSLTLLDQKVIKEVPISPDQEITEETDVHDPNNANKSLILCDQEITKEVPISPDQEITKEVPTSPDQEVTEKTTDVHDSDNANKSLILCDQEVTKEVPTSSDQKVTKEVTDVHDPDNANKSLILCDQEVTKEEPASPDQEVTKEEPASPDQEVTKEEPASPDQEVTKEVPTSPDQEVTKEVSASPDQEVTKELAASPYQKIAEEATAVHDPDIANKSLILCDREVTEEVPTSPDQEVMKEVPASPNQGVTKEVPASPDQEVTKEVPASPDQEVTKEVPASPDQGVTKEVPASPDQGVTKEVPASPDQGVTKEVPASPDQEVTKEVPASPDQEVTKEVSASPDQEVTKEVPASPDQGVTKEVPASPYQEVTEEPTAVHDPDNANKLLILCDQEVTKEVPTSCDQEVTEEVPTSPDQEVTKKAILPDKLRIVLGEEQAKKGTLSDSESSKQATAIDVSDNNNKSLILSDQGLKIHNSKGSKEADTEETKEAITIGVLDYNEKSLILHNQEETNEALTLSDQENTEEVPILPDMEDNKETKAVDDQEKTKEAALFQESTTIDDSDNSDDSLILPDEVTKELSISPVQKETKETTAVGDPNNTGKSPTLPNQKEIEGIQKLPDQDVNKELTLPDSKGLKEATTDDPDNSNELPVLPDQEQIEEVIITSSEEATTIGDLCNTDQSIILHNKKETNKTLTSPDQEETKETTAVGDPDFADESLILHYDKETRGASELSDHEVTEEPTTIDDPKSLILPDQEETKVTENTKEMSTVRDLGYNKELLTIQDSEAIKEVSTLLNSENTKRIQELPDSEDTSELQTLYEEDDTNKIFTLPDSEETSGVQTLCEEDDTNKMFTFPDSEDTSDVQTVYKEDDTNKMLLLPDSYCIRKGQKLYNSADFDDITPLPNPEDSKELLMLLESENASETSNTPNLDGMKEIPKLCCSQDLKEMPTVPKLQDIKEVQAVLDSEGAQKASTKEMPGICNLENIQDISNINKTDDMKEIPTLSSSEDNSKIPIVSYSGCDDKDSEDSKTVLTVPVSEDGKEVFTTSDSEESNNKQVITGLEDEEALIAADSEDTKETTFTDDSEHPKKELNLLVSEGTKEESPLPDSEDYSKTQAIASLTDSTKSPTIADSEDGKETMTQLNLANEASAPSDLEGMEEESALCNSDGSKEMFDLVSHKESISLFNSEDLKETSNSKGSYEQPTLSGSEDSREKSTLPDSKGSKELPTLHFSEDSKEPSTLPDLDNSEEKSTVPSSEDFKEKSTLPSSEDPKETLPLPNLDSKETSTLSDSKDSKEISMLSDLKGSKESQTLPILGYFKDSSTLPNSIGPKETVPISEVKKLKLTDDLKCTKGSPTISFSEGTNKKSTLPDSEGFKELLALHVDVLLDSEEANDTSILCGSKISKEPLLFLDSQSSVKASSHTNSEEIEVPPVSDLKDTEKSPTLSHSEASKGPSVLDCSENNRKTSTLHDLNDTKESPTLLVSESTNEITKLSSTKDSKEASTLHDLQFCKEVSVLCSSKDNKEVQIIHDSDYFIKEPELLANPEEEVIKLQEQPTAPNSEDREDPLNLINLLLGEESSAYYADKESTLRSKYDKSAVLELINEKESDNIIESDELFRDEVKENDEEINISLGDEEESSTLLNLCSHDILKASDLDITEETLNYHELKNNEYSPAQLNFEVKEDAFNIGEISTPFCVRGNEGTLLFSTSELLASSYSRENLEVLKLLGLNDGDKKHALSSIGENENTTQLVDSGTWEETYYCHMRSQETGKTLVSLKTTNPEQRLNLSSSVNTKSSRYVLEGQLCSDKVSPNQCNCFSSKGGHDLIGNLPSTTCRAVADDQVCKKSNGERIPPDKHNERESWSRELQAGNPRTAAPPLDQNNDVSRVRDHVQAGSSPCGGYSQPVGPRELHLSAVLVASEHASTETKTTVYDSNRAGLAGETHVHRVVQVERPSNLLERFPSGEEPDKAESDTDSQDTVIDGESYRRIRSLAVTEKLLCANQELSVGVGGGCVLLASEATPGQTTLAVSSERSAESFPSETEGSNLISRDDAICDALSTTLLLSAPHDGRSVGNDISEYELVDCWPGKGCISSRCKEITLVSHCENKPGHSTADSMGPSKLEKPIVFAVAEKEAGAFTEDTCMQEEKTDNNITQINENTHTESDFGNNEQKCELKNLRFMVIAEELDDSENFEGDKTKTDDFFSSDEDSVENRESPSEDDSLSDSSDEASYSAPVMGYLTPMYGNPLAYSLHTIMEESCEESERGSQTNTPTISSTDSQLDKYFSLAIAPGGAVEDKRTCEETSEGSSEISDSLSETSGSVYSEVAEEYLDNDDDAVLASSRLEKYFTSGLLGSDHLTYPENTEFSDRNDSINNDDKDFTAHKSYLLTTSSVEELVVKGCTSLSCISKVEENAFDKDDNTFDTIKRKREDGCDINDIYENKTEKEEYITMENGTKITLETDVNKLSILKYSRLNTIVTSSFRNDTNYNSESDQLRTRETEWNLKIPLYDNDQVQNALVHKNNLSTNQVERNNEQENASSEGLLLQQEPHLKHKSNEFQSNHRDTAPVVSQSESLGAKENICQVIEDDHTSEFPLNIDYKKSVEVDTERCDEFCDYKEQTCSLESEKRYDNEKKQEFITILQEYTDSCDQNYEKEYKKARKEDTFVNSVEQEQTLENQNNGHNECVVHQENVFTETLEVDDNISNIKTNNEKYKDDYLETKQKSIVCSVKQTQQGQGEHSQFDKMSTAGSYMTEEYSDEEASYIMNRLMAHLSESGSETSAAQECEEGGVLPPWKSLLESQIARLMETVSPTALSEDLSSSCSSTLESNNSDYGSDTLESGEYTSTDDEEVGNFSIGAGTEFNIKTLRASLRRSSQTSASGDSSDSTISEETMYICKQLMSSLKQLAEPSVHLSAMTPRPTPEGSDDFTRARDYIKDQIVALMHSVTTSQNNSPTREQHNTPANFQIDHTSNCMPCIDDIQESPELEIPKPSVCRSNSIKSKAPSESGSEATMSASISIPSYDDSDRTPTESEISHEMDELFALLDATSGAFGEPMAGSRLSAYDSELTLVDDSMDVLSTPECTLVSPNEEQIFDYPEHDMDGKLSDHTLEGKTVASSQITESCSGISNLSGSQMEGLSSGKVPSREKSRIWPNSSNEELNDIAEEEEGEGRIGSEGIFSRYRYRKHHVKKGEVLHSTSPGYHGKEVLNWKPSVIDNSSLIHGKMFASSPSGIHYVTDPPSLDSPGSSMTSYLSQSHQDLTGCSHVFPTLQKSTSGENILKNSRSREKLAAYRKERADRRFSLHLWLEQSTALAEEQKKNRDNELDDANDEGAVHDPEDDSRGSTPCPKAINSTEKSCSENNLLLANYQNTGKTSVKVFGTKSTGNIADLEIASNKNTFRDTGYYSFKSSEESVRSLDDSTASRASSTSLLHQKSLTSSETIPEVEEEPAKPGASGNPRNISLSSGNIPDSVANVAPSKSSTLPSGVRSRIFSQPSTSQRTRQFTSSFFSTSGVLRKLTALRDESATVHRSSPRGRLRGRTRIPSGGNEDARQSTSGVPQISVSDYGESISGRGSVASSDKDSSVHLDEDVDQVFSYHCSSQASLTTFSGRSESMTSVYSAAGGGRYGTVTVTGDVLFSLSYNYKNGILETLVKECRNLAAVDSKRNRSDPYVKVYLLPDRTKGGKRKTKVKKHTLNPIFDEILRFPVTLSELETRTLWLSVWHSDMFGRNEFLGEVMIPLGHDVLENSNLIWHPLQERLEAPESPLSYKGDLVLSLKYVPPDVTATKKGKVSLGVAKGSLHILVKEARNLMATRSNGTSDPFCKSYLLPDKSKNSKQKTPVLKKTCNPKWNHTFVYDDVTLDDLKERCLELTVWDYDKITSNDFLGGVRLSAGTGKFQGRTVDWMDSQMEETCVWKAMLDRLNMWVDCSLLLRPSMQTRKS
ncbi:LOW QUALITY PROTEIN: uncharacterized protein LOC143222307 [Tachypleus tridentatus]|uniref:LOW QUALITY PROTEIN: uncharacterized protein LOC143222307 n=1 Tax=Tachypleus tridentatus TaxID=6853 RepID=UPI003FD19B95